MTMIRLKRAGDKPQPQDGYRIFVDSLWPRGLSEQEAGVNEWLKDAAPSTQLRSWFTHEPDKWEDFRKRYVGELRDKTAVAEHLRSILDDHATVTLVYGRRTGRHTSAEILKEYIQTEL